MPSQGEQNASIDRSCRSHRLCASSRGAALCPAPPAKRSDCIHDGDTWWFEGVKYRHSEIDTPEIGHTAACTAELEIGLKARDRLVELTAGGFSIETTGEKDRYDRVLATIRLPDGREAGEVLLAEGLAEAYGMDRETDWCEAR